MIKNMKFFYDDRILEKKHCHHENQVFFSHIWGFTVNLGIPSTRRAKLVKVS